jgi:hypothetical protein
MRHHKGASIGAAADAAVLSMVKINAVAETAARQSITGRMVS